MPSIMPADDFYTKPQIDEMLEDIVESGCCITPEEVDEKIEQAVSGKQDTLVAGDNITISGNVISASGCDLTGYATEQWVLDRHYITDVDPTLNSGSTNPVANSAITNALDAKLDATAYTPTDLSNYYTKNETSAKTEIQSALNLKQDALVAGENITISGNVISAGCGCDLSDYVTDGELSAYTYDKQTIDQKIGEGGIFDPTQYYTRTVIDNKLAEKQDVSGMTAYTLNADFSAHTANTDIHTTTSEKNYWNSKVDAATLNNYMLKTQIWCGTQAEYNIIPVKSPDVIYLIHS